jgi:hypothetical protein
MTILFDARRPVKPARPFAAGLAAPSRRPAAFEPDDSDRAWAAAEFAAAEAARLDRACDLMAAEALATDALCRGLIPPDLAA